MFGPCTQYLPAVAGTAKTVAVTRATRNDVFPKCMSISESSLSNQSCVLHFVPKLTKAVSSEARITTHPWAHRGGVSQRPRISFPANDKPQAAGQLGVW